MEPTITGGKQLCEHADISESRFDDVNMAGASFNDVNMAGVRFDDINLSDISVTRVQMGGARFCCVGLPPCAEGEGKQRPVEFTKCDLNGSTFAKCDLSGVEIAQCDVSGMKIDGIPVAELLAAHRERQS